MSDLIAPVEPTPVEPVPSTRTKMRQQRSQGRGGTTLLVAAALVAVAGLAFAAGRFTAPVAAATIGGNNFQGNFPGGSFAPGQFRGAPGGFSGGVGSISIRGTVTAVAADSITLQLDNGTTITIPTDGQTTYHKATVASASDVAVGSTVDVTPGAANIQPGASPAPGATFIVGGPGGGGFSSGPARDVTVVEP